MTTPYSSFLAPDSSHHDQVQTSNPGSGSRGRARGTTGAKRGRKPRGTVVAGASSPRPIAPLAPSGGTASPSTSTPVSFLTSNAQNPNTQYSRVHSASPAAGETSSAASVPVMASLANTATVAGDSITSNPPTHSSGPVIDPALVGVTAMPPVSATPRL